MQSDDDDVLAEFLAGIDIDPALYRILRDLDGQTNGRSIQEMVKLAEQNGKNVEEMFENIAHLAETNFVDFIDKGGDDVSVRISERGIDFLRSLKKS